MKRFRSKYTCAKCGGTFESPWSDEDARKEYEAVFTPAMRAADGRPPTIVCDICYREMLRKLPPEEAFDEFRKTWKGRSN